jgi:hypothetical protein
MNKCLMKHKAFVSIDEMSATYGMILDSKALSSVFYDGSCHTYEAFLEAFSQPDMHFWLLFYEGQIAGLAWLNGMVHTRAFAHFCMFKNVYGRSTEGLSKSVEIGRYCVANWLLHTDENGKPLVDVLVGVTPERNRMALKWVQRVGFSRVGSVPHGVWMHDAGESEDAVLSYATRKTIDPSWAGY